MLMREISTLKQQKANVEEDLIQKTVDLSRAKENLEKHHLTVSLSSSSLSKLEVQIEQLSADNIRLRSELNDAKVQLMARNSMVDELKCQLNESKNRDNAMNELRV